MTQNSAPPGCPLDLGCGPAGPVCMDYFDCAQEAGIDVEEDE